MTVLRCRGDDAVVHRRVRGWPGADGLRASCCSRWCGCGGGIRTCSSGWCIWCCGRGGGGSRSTGSGGRRRWTPPGSTGSGAACSTTRRCEGRESTRSVDRVRVRMLPGQTVEDWAKVSDRLCQTFGAQDCRVRSVTRPAARARAVVPHQRPAGRAGAADLAGRAGGEPGRAADRVGVRTARSTGCRCAATTCCVSGATGAGKGSVLWSIIDQLAPAVRRRHGRAVGARPEGRHGTRRSARPCSPGSSTAPKATSPTPWKPPSR